MQLAKLMETVLDSSPDSWRLVTGEIAVYRPDVSISMSWGAEFVEVRFHNSLVYRTPYVLSNGTFFPLPQPARDGTLAVTRHACALMKIVDALGRAPRPGYSSYESDLSRAGFTIVDGDVPGF